LTRQHDLGLSVGDPADAPRLRVAIPLPSRDRKLNLRSALSELKE
jgi:hypothetical protein